MKEQLGNLDLPFFSMLSPEGHCLKGGDIVEFSGTEGTGKSEILLNITVRCILPKICQGRKLGREVEVIFISTDHKFDLQRLTTLIESHLSTCWHTPVVQGQSIPDPEYRKLVMSCLARVYVVHCNTSNELTLTFEYMKTFLHNHSQVCALMLDNVAAYYWLDRDKSEGAQNHWISSLHELIKGYHLVVFASKPLLFHKAASKSWPKDMKV